MGCISNSLTFGPTFQMTNGLFEGIGGRRKPQETGRLPDVEPVRCVIQRNGSGRHATLGRFRIFFPKSRRTLDGATMELPRGRYDIGIHLGVKQYPIPAGTYTGRPSSRFGCFMINIGHVRGECNYEAVQLHLGNYPWNSHACILIGNQTRTDLVVTEKMMKPHDSMSAEERWRIAVKSGSITETSPGNGKTDFLGGSGMKLEQISLLYGQEKAYCAGSAVPFSISVSD